MIYLSTVHLSPNIINHHLSIFMHSILNVTLGASDMYIYSENVPLNFIKHTHK